MSLTWEPTLVTTSMISCMQSSRFDVFNNTNQLAYCAYKAPSLEVAQVCCPSYRVVRHPQDNCTFICNNGTMGMLNCLHSVLGTISNSQFPIPGDSASFGVLYGQVAQIKCFDLQGFEYLNTSRKHATNASRQLGTGVAYSVSGAETFNHSRYNATLLDDKGKSSSKSINQSGPGNTSTIYVEVQRTLNFAVQSTGSISRVCSPVLSLVVLCILLANT